MSEKILSLADLKTDKKNARKHNVRNISMIENSLRSVGAARSGVIDENGVILAGNGTYEALASAGIEKVRVVETDGNEWVVVKRTGLSEEQKRQLALADNRAAELATWDAPTLAEQGIDLKPWFSPDELHSLMNRQGEGLPHEDQSGLLTTTFNILIECKTEQEQLELLERFAEEGIACRALIS